MARADRNGKRKSRDKTKKIQPYLGYYFVVTDAKATEKNYLQGLKNSLPEEMQKRVVIRISQAQTKYLVDSCISQAALQPQYSEPWIVFDRDQVSNFDTIVREAQNHGINVGWSNPCIEIWFDAYFGQMHGYQESKQCWLRFAETYNRVTGLEYNKSDEHIYEIMNKYGDEEKAIEIAQLRINSYLDSGIYNPSDMCPGTTLFLLVKDIKKRVE